MQSSNPVLQPGAFTGVEIDGTNRDVMTTQGVVMKTGVLICLVLLSAGYTWMKFFQAGANPNAVSGWMMVGLFGGFITAMITVFKKEWSPVTTPVYAVLEGFFIGGVSAVLETQFPGIVIQAAMLTFGTLLAMLAAYESGMIKVTEGFKLGVVAATGGIALVYLATLVLGFFGVNVPFVNSGGMMGIGFSLFVVVIAALNFVLDFDMIDQSTRKRLPKYMEWYCSFGLMVTLVWLYIEFLRLLSKIREK